MKYEFCYTLMADYNDTYYRSIIISDPQRIEKYKIFWDKLLPLVPLQYSQYVSTFELIVDTATKHSIELSEMINIEFLEYYSNRYNTSHGYSTKTFANIYEGLISELDLHSFSNEKSICNLEITDWHYKDISDIVSDYDIVCYLKKNNPEYLAEIKTTIIDNRG